MLQKYTAHLHTDWPDSIIRNIWLWCRVGGWDVFQTILYKIVNGKLTAAIIPQLHNTRHNHKKYKGGLGGGGCSQTNCQIRGYTFHKGQKSQPVNWGSQGSGTQGGIEVVHGTRGTKVWTKMWYRGWYRNTHTYTHYYSYIITYFLNYHLHIIKYLFFVTNTTYAWGVDTPCLHAK